MRSAVGVLYALGAFATGGALIGLGLTSGIAMALGHSEQLTGHPLMLIPGLALWYSAGLIGAWAMDRIDRY